MQDKTLTDSKRRNRMSRRAQRTQQSILSAALHLFSEKGIDSTTIKEITERADIGKGSFYNHFDNKDAVAIALIELAVDRLISRINISDDERSDLPGAIAHLVQAYSAFFHENQEEFLLLFQGRLLLKLQRETPEELEHPYIRYLEAIAAQVIPHLPTGVDPVKLRRFACALAGFVSGFFSFAAIGMTDEEMVTSLSPLRQVFVVTSSVFLQG